jgi:hypothetical protein
VSSDLYLSEIATRFYGTSNWHLIRIIQSWVQPYTNDWLTCSNIWIFGNFMNLVPQILRYFPKPKFHEENYELKHDAMRARPIDIFPDIRKNACRNNTEICRKSVLLSTIGLKLVSHAIQPLFSSSIQLSRQSQCQMLAVTCARLGILQKLREKRKDVKFCSDNKRWLTLFVDTLNHSSFGSFRKTYTVCNSEWYVVWKVSELFESATPSMSCTLRTQCATVSTPKAVPPHCVSLLRMP